MTLQEFADKINGKQIEEWQTSYEMDADAKRENKVTAYVYDTEFPFLSLEGAFEGDFDIYADNSGFDSIDFTKEGKRLGDEDLSTLRYYKPDFNDFNTIEVYNKFEENGEVSATWSIELPEGLPFAKFNIFKGEELFCIGIVFEFEILK